jgi:hypothetical protein
MILIKTFNPDKVAGHVYRLTSSHKPAKQNKAKRNRK